MVQKCLAFAPVQWARPDVAKAGLSPLVGPVGPAGFWPQQALLGVARLGSTLAFASERPVRSPRASSPLRMPLPSG